ncbi:MAG: hypothetical protein FJW99_05920 [Actinobacteria bacterium]|nr:hypothetical protein [Actinomycetota bacterium]MBM3697391.1 hypothetical protein [Actinomycetota bacterium]
MPRSLRLIAAIAGCTVVVSGAGVAAGAPGVVTEYPSNTFNVSPAGIAVGPDGTAYAGFNTSNLVVPFTAAGAGAHIPVGAASGLVNSIAPGPDGQMARCG